MDRSDSRLSEGSRARGSRGHALAAGLVFALTVGFGTASATGFGAALPDAASDPIGELGDGAGEALSDPSARAASLKRCLEEHGAGDDGAPAGNRDRTHGHPHPHDEGDPSPTNRGKAAALAAARKHCAEHQEADPQDDFTGFGGEERRQQGGGKPPPPAGQGAPARGRASGKTAGKTTLQERIVGGDPEEGFQFLGLGPGEARIVREDLTAAKSGREERRESVIYFAQTTDWQIVDEESPSRVEFFDITANEPFPTAFSAAHRPQEALVPFGVEMAVRQINRFADESPHRQGDGSRAEMDMVLMTGDQADNAQLNETEWTVTLMQGGELRPGSGQDPSSCPPGQMPQGQTADPERYAGVQDYEDYAAGGQQFYDPNQPAGMWGDWPRYPGLMDRAQLPFGTTGFKVPSYVTPGNHDGLAQGNEAILGPFEDVGTGCVKPIVPVASLTNPGDFEDNLTQVLDPGFLAGLITSNPGQVMFVPPDENRQYVDKAQYKETFDTGFQDDAHGFDFVDPEELEASNGAASYYAWNPEPGLRMISIDTLCEGGVTGPGSNGNLDDPQFEWLRGELERAQGRDELIIVFGHHPIRSMGCNLPDEAAPPCTIDDEHGHDVNPGCDRDPRDSGPIRLGADLEAQFREFPNVIAYVAGHTHENNISNGERSDGAAGDFWGIETASLVDWPPQNRLVELMDNCDGTLSFFGTVIDSAAPATAPQSDTDASEMDTPTLASISRTLAYNDPQAGPGGGGDGVAEDRNVELLIDDPRPEPSECTRLAGEGPEPTDRDGKPAADGEPATEEAGVTAERAGELPFTGFLVLLLALIAAGLLGGGRLARRLSQRRG